MKGKYHGILWHRTGGNSGRLWNDGKIAAIISIEISKRIRMENAKCEKKLDRQIGGRGKVAAKPKNECTT